MADDRSLLAARKAFALLRADAIAASLGVTVSPRRPSRGWTTRAVWYETEGRLVGVLGPQEGSKVDLGLAHGLYLAGGRRLCLALPSEWAYPTLQRLPWLNAVVEVHVYAQDETTAALVTPESRLRTSRLAGGPETKPELHLGPLGEHVRPLLEWAAQHPDLAAAHRRDVRAWSCRGQRVLAVRSTKKRIEIISGIDAKADRAAKDDVSSPPTARELATWQHRVEVGIQHAKQQTFGRFEEHHLQEILRRNPSALGLEAPVLREVPAWRPIGGPKRLGRGYLDLVAMDGLGDINLVETKLAADEMLVLQGLDYWIWAANPDNAKWLTERLHADPNRASPRLVYAVGGKGGKSPTLSRYAKLHLDLLHDDVSWRLALINDWLDGTPTVELLPLRARP